jgi:hypothetical protein
MRNYGDTKIFHPLEMVYENNKQGNAIKWLKTDSNGINMKGSSRAAAVHGYTPSQKRFQTAMPVYDKPIIIAINMMMLVKGKF